MRIRFVSWNVHSCVGTDGRYDPARTAEVLKSLNADVIGLQEIDWRKPTIDGRDQFSYLADALGMTPIEGPNLTDHLGHYGNGLLTRLGVEGVRRVEIAHPKREPRGLIDTILHADGCRVRTLVTHLGLQRRERRNQLRRIARHLKEVRPCEAMPLLCLGDFNEWAPFRARQVLHPDVAHTFEAAPRTFPSYAPFFRLDRITAASDSSLEAIRIEPTVMRTLASDHIPVCVSISLSTMKTYIGASSR